MDYLAFDFGDGTTTAAHYGDALSGCEPLVLNISRGESEIWSCIGVDRNGVEPPQIGKAADAPGYDVRTNWKSYPSRYCETEEGRENRRTAVEFMRCVFSSFLAQNPEYGAGGTYRNGPCKIVIGVPCDWTHEDIEEYQQMATEAGIPHPEVIKESHAGMFYARRWMRNGISDDSIRNGVLMIDVGSSTTDFTYLKGADAVRNRGIPLGAAKVEEMFLAEGMKRENVRYWPISGEDVHGLRILAVDREEGDSSYKTDLMELRGHKEAYFTKADSVRSPSERVPSLPNSGMRIGERGYIVESFVDYCLNYSGSPCGFCLTNVSDVWDYDAKVEFAKPKVWREHFRTALRYVRDGWEIDGDTAIVVTGGATRMQFIEEDIKEVFASKQKPYFGSDGARSFSVVKGLAWAGFAKEEIKKARCQIEKYFERENVYETFGVYELVDSVLEKHAREIADEVREKMVNLLRSHNRSVSSVARLKKCYSNLVCGEWNRLLERLNDNERTPVNVSSILNSSVLFSMTSDLHKKFGRPNVSVSTDVPVMIDYKIVEACMRFDPFGESLFSPDDDADFDGCLGWGLKWNAPLDAVKKKITTDCVMSHFKAELHNVDTGAVIPSLYETLCSAVLEKVCKFKLSEIDAIGGFVEYN